MTAPIPERRTEPSATDADARRLADNRLRRLTGVASVAVACTLIVAKGAAYILTDSVALLSALLDSLLDAAASAVSLLAIHHALAPADREHRFGHGKAEPLAALAQAAFITGSAVLLLFEALHRLISPQPVQNTGIGIAVMVFSMVLTGALIAVQRRTIRRTGSLAIQADSLHYVGDLLLNAVVIASLVLSGWLATPYLDPLFGAAIALYILVSVWRILTLAVTQLMDRELPDDERARIRRIAEAHPDVARVHDLRTRAAGPQAFIQLHLEMDGRMSLYRAHSIGDAVEAEIQAAFPNAEVLVHHDPEGLEEPPTFGPPPTARAATGDVAPAPADPPAVGSGPSAGGAPGSAARGTSD